MLLCYSHYVLHFKVWVVHVIQPWLLQYVKNPKPNRPVMASYSSWAMIGWHLFRWGGLWLVSRISHKILTDFSSLKISPVRYNPVTTEAPANSQLGCQSKWLNRLSTPLEHADEGTLVSPSFICQWSEQLLAETFSKCQTCWEPWQTSTVTENSHRWHLHLTFSTLFFLFFSLLK